MVIKIVLVAQMSVNLDNIENIYQMYFYAIER